MFCSKIGKANPQVETQQTSSSGIGIFHELLCFNPFLIYGTASLIQSKMMLMLFFNFEIK